MKAILKNDWMPLLSEHFESEDYIRLRRFLIDEYKNHTIYPGPFDIFNALHYTPYAAARVVILGQDPYHGPNQAHGLSFSVLKGNKIPPSLINIYKELQDDLGCTIPSHGYLKKWADQGVLMLNAVLTVRAGQANSHKGMGWENFTDNVIRLMNRKEKPVVFILWGANARAKKKLLDPKHCVIESAHPSPLSAHAGFFGSKPFGRCNAFLRDTGQEEIDWQIDA